MDHVDSERYWYVFSLLFPYDKTDTTTACTFGAAIICVDLIIRLFPGKKNFKIEDSNGFLSTGLSLSFGVMVRCQVTLRVLAD